MNLDADMLLSRGRASMAASDDAEAAEARRQRILAERLPAREALATGSWAPPESPSRVLPYLYVGSKEDARDLPLLLKLGVTHVLNAAAGLAPAHADRFVYLHIGLEDEKDEDVASAFAEASAFIEDARAGGGVVLVHCAAGISRSVSLVLAWLVGEERMQLRAALALVRRRRPFACPNEGFRLALARFELRVAGASSVVGAALGRGMRKRKRAGGAQGAGDSGAKDEGAGAEWSFEPWSSECRACAQRSGEEGMVPLSELGAAAAGSLADGSPALEANVEAKAPK